MDIIKEYTKIIRNHVRSDRYGYDDEDTPKHANPKGSKGWYNRFSGKWEPTRLRNSDIFTHLIGETPFYLVNKPQSRTCLICLDIDHNGATNALEIGDRINRCEFASSGFTEPSRHGKGAYVWLRLERDTSDDPDGTNAILNSFSARLKVLYNVPESAKVDALKATLFTSSSRGVLATAPCYWRHSEEHVQQFIGWYRSSVPFPLSRMSEAVRLAEQPTFKQGASNSGDKREGSNYLGGTSVPVAENEDGPRRRARLFRAIILRNPDTTEDEFVAAYQVLTPNNNRPDDARDDFRKMKAKFKVHAPSFNPKAIRPHCDTVPDDAFLWKRREKLDRDRLADFVAVKLQDAFARKANGYFAMASRDATLANFRALKQKGLVDWICTQHQYTKLLDIACKKGLLHIYEDFEPPIRSKSGVKVFKGRARLIGPGAALPEQRARFLRLYEQWRHVTNVAAA